MTVPMATGTTDLAGVFAQQLAGGKLELPPLPATAAEVLASCQQASTDAAKLSAILHRDQAIASNVLRVANSAAYAGQMPCASLQQAVSRLGLQLISEIALAVAVRGRLFADPAAARLLTALWQHSVLTGFYAKEVARLRRRNVEIAFLCGLLHDIGKAVLLTNVERLVPGASLPTAEVLAAVDRHHVAAGLSLGAQWRLPEQVLEALQCHHDPAAAQRFPELAMSVCLADLLAHRTSPSCLAAPIADADLRQHPVLIGLNIYSDQLDGLLGLRERALLLTEGMR